MIIFTHLEYLHYCGNGAVLVGTLYYKFLKVVLILYPFFKGATETEAQLQRKVKHNILNTGHWIVVMPNISNVQYSCQICHKPHKLPSTSQCSCQICQMNKQLPPIHAKNARCNISCQKCQINCQLLSIHANMPDALSPA